MTETKLNFFCRCQNFSQILQKDSDRRWKKIKKCNFFYNISFFLFLSQENRIGDREKKIKIKFFFYLIFPKIPSPVSVIQTIKKKTPYILIRKVFIDAHKHLVWNLITVFNFFSPAIRIFLKYLGKILTTTKIEFCFSQLKK